MNPTKNEEITDILKSQSYLAEYKYSINELTEDELKSNQMLALAEIKKKKNLSGQSREKNSTPKQGHSRVAHLDEMHRRS